MVQENKVRETEKKLSELEQAIETSRTARTTLIKNNQEDLKKFTGNNRFRSQRRKQQKRAEEIALNTIRVLSTQIAKTRQELNKSRLAQSQGRTTGEITLQERTSIARERSVQARKERESKEQQETITAQEFRKRERERFVARGESLQATQEETTTAQQAVIRRGEVRTETGGKVGFTKSSNIAFAVTGKPKTTTEERILRNERGRAREKDAFGSFVKTQEQAQLPKEKDAFSLTPEERKEFLAPVQEVEKPSFYQKAYTYFAGRSTLGVSDVTNAPIVATAALGAVGTAFRLAPAITQTGQVASFGQSAGLIGRNIGGFLSPARKEYLGQITRAGVVGISTGFGVSLAGRELTERAGIRAGSTLTTAQTRNILTQAREAEGIAIEQAYPSNINIPFTDGGIRIPKPTEGVSEIAGARTIRIQAGRARIGRELTELGLKGEDFKREFNILTAQRGGYAATFATASVTAFGAGEATGTLLQTGIKGTTGKIGGLTAVGIGARQGFFRVGGGGAVELAAIDVSSQTLSDKPFNPLQTAKAAGLGFLAAGTGGALVRAPAVLGKGTGRAGTQITSTVLNIADPISEPVGDLFFASLNRKLGKSAIREPTVKFKEPKTRSIISGRTKGFTGVRTFGVTPSKTTRVATVTPTFNILGAGTKTQERRSGRSITGTDTITGTRTGTKSRTTLRTLTPTLTRTTTSTKTPTATRTITPTFTNTFTNTLTTTKVPTVTTGFPFIPFLGKGKKTTRKKKSGSGAGARPFSYTASLKATQLGIFTSKPQTPKGGFTGFETRGILKRGKTL